MSFKELRSLAQQLTYAYGALKRSARPMPLHFTSMNSPAGLLIKEAPGTENWKVHMHEDKYTHVFADRLASVYYLSPEADEVLWEIERDAVYVIGGIVDRNRLKGTSLERAKADNVKCVRLPIAESLKRPVGNSLNVNHGTFASHYFCCRVFLLFVGLRFLFLFLSSHGFDSSFRL
eukprot:TRINITY_DN5728_c0_g1_i1.p1 TRINITY_DN5728_c0_g1~~TRINITY_DN5728_c0_g1_i1.p1  ORF type:complete len:176 (+),score=39.06 TRINITY_DN5728_c0_g1_i1:590-1117(+)